MAAGYTGVGTGMSTTTNLWTWFGELLYTNVLEEYYPRLLLHDFAEHIMFGANQGWHIYRPQWTKVKPVSELVFSSETTVGGETDETLSPASHKMALTNYDGFLQIFGGSFQFSDTFMATTQIVEVLSAGARMLGADYAENVEDNALKAILETLNLTKATAAPIHFGANNTVWGATVATDTIEMGDIFRATTEFTSNVDGATYTFPDGTYKCIMHPRVRHDLFNNPSSATAPNLINWLTTTRGQGMYEAGKIPVLDNVAIDFSAHNTTDPYNSHAAFGGVDSWPDELDTAGGALHGFATDAVDQGYLTLFIAPGAYANVDLANATPSLIVQPFGSGGPADSLKREMTIGVKGVQTCVPQDVHRRLAVMATGASTL